MGLPLRFRKTQRFGTTLAVLLVIVALVNLQLPSSAGATASLVQSTTGIVNGGASVTATYTSAPAAGDLLIAICGAPTAVTIAGPTGFTAAKNESGTPSQGIFYKVSAGNETGAQTCSNGTSSTRWGMQLYEFNGMLGTSPLDAVNTTASTGSSATASSGTVTTTNATDLLIAGVTVAGSNTIGTWNSTFVSLNGFSNSGSKSSQGTYGGADLITSATGSYSTTVPITSAAWRGQIAAFKLAPPGVLTTDIVDGSGVSVASPGLTMSTSSRSFACQTVTGTLGTSTQKVRVNNTTTAPAWTLSIAATGGATSSWTAGMLKYDYNDPATGGCSDGADADSLAGQLSIDPSVGTLTPQSGCSNTGVTLGSSSAFSEGTVDAINLATAGSTASLNCYWDLTNLAFSQTVPASQAAGTYSLNLTLTLVAN